MPAYQIAEKREGDGAYANLGTANVVFFLFWRTLCYRYVESLFHKLDDFVIIPLRNVECIALYSSATAPVNAYISGWALQNKSVQPDAQRNRPAVSNSLKAVFWDRGQTCTSPCFFLSFQFLISFLLNSCTISEPNNQAFFKGTQDWDFFLLRFWNLYYFLLVMWKY